MTNGIKTPVARLTLTIALAIGGSALAIDLITKAAARSMLSVGDPIAVAPGFNLVLSFNRGVTFGLFPVESATGLAVMIVLQFCIVVMLAISAWRTPEALHRVCFSLIIAGALGNVFDRLTVGAVTDFIDLHAGQWHWPTFNLADTFIVAGVAGLLTPQSFTRRVAAAPTQKSEV